ncbi:MAG TPA: hypothetical protein VMD08_17930 [Candidatus Baltobacteraceae bacterium]|nr:hypothetical protein [Candidatus Baltobacteraceae bacterium]
MSLHDLVSRTVADNPEASVREVARDVVDATAPSDLYDHYMQALTSYVAAACGTTEID